MTAAVTSGKLAFAAAIRIADEVVATKLLSNVELSNRAQVIQLIGHSRGAAVNALVSGRLMHKGCKNITDFIALDGFSTDWAFDAGLIGDIPIVNAKVGANGQKLNYRVEFGLATTELLTTFALSELRGEGYIFANINDIPRVSKLATDTFGDLRAPPRSTAGFDDITIPNSTHVNIHDIFFNSVYKRNTYEGKHATDGLSPNGEGEFSSILPLEGDGGEVMLATKLTPGFVDGKLDHVGGLWLTAQSLEIVTTDDLFFNVMQAKLAGSSELLGLSWQTVGEVELVRNDDNFAVRLRAGSELASLAQFVILPEKATSVDVDLEVVSAVAGDQLVILWNGEPLASFELADRVGASHLSVPLPADLDELGTFTFQLTSGGGAATEIILDNFAIIANNQAPELSALAFQLPTVGTNIADSKNLGIAVWELTQGMFDADGDVCGIAIVGANPQAGLLQFSLDGGATWRSIGSPSESQAFLISADLANRVRFVPQGGFVGIVDNALTFRAWDQTTGILGLSGDYFDTTTGQFAAFSAAADTASIEFELVVDTESPSVTVNQHSAQADPASGTTVRFSVVFSEPVGGFLPSDVDFTGSTVPGTLSAVIQGAGPAYEVLVSGMTGTGLIQMRVNAGAATDGAGNPSLASTSIDRDLLWYAPGPLQIASVDVWELQAGAVVGAVTVPGLPAGRAWTLAVDDPRFEFSQGQLRLKSDQSVSRSPAATIPLLLALHDGALAISQSLTINVLANAFPWHNYLRAEDAEGDNDVDINDAIFIIRKLRRGEGGPLMVPKPAALLGGSFYDVDANRTANIQDAIAVIRYLRRNRGGGGEGEGEITSNVSLPSTASRISATSAADLVFLNWSNPKARRKDTDLSSLN